MGMGLETFDKDGNKIFDAQTLTTRVLGSGRTNGVDGSLTDTNIQNRKVWIKNTVVHKLGNKMPLYTVEGNKISWKHYFPAESGGISWDTAGLENADCEFIYGTF